MTESDVASQAGVPWGRRWFVRSLAAVSVAAGTPPPWSHLWTEPVTWCACAVLLPPVGYLGRVVWRATAPEGAANLRGRMGWPERAAAVSLLAAAALLLADRWGGPEVLAR